MFSELSLHQPLLKAIDRLGFTEPTPVQRKAIPAALNGDDLLVSAQTGSGKTAAFLLPTLQRLLSHAAPNTGTRALILLPTRELALQTLKACEQLIAFCPLKAGIIVGGEPFKHQVAMLRKNPEILIATPGRLVEHIERNTPDFNDLEVLILDEADRMLDLGFSEDLLLIAKKCAKERQNLLFSATLKTGIQRIADDILQHPQILMVDNPRAANADITQKVHLIDDAKHRDKVSLALISEQLGIEHLNSRENKIMVFCNTRAQCDQLSSWLAYKKVDSAVLHSEIRQSDRKQTLNRFRQGHVQLLITTDVAARGLDIQAVQLVLHYDVPRSGDDYVHRSGRTARAGETGVAVLLVDANAWDNMAKIERFLKQRFSQFFMPGLAAKYQGPKKLKSSGKAAGKKKKNADKKTNKPQAKKKASQKAGAKRKKSRSAADLEPRDGFSALRRKKSP